MSAKLNIYNYKERILKAATLSGDADRILRMTFPEVFEEVASVTFPSIRPAKCRGRTNGIVDENGDMIVEVRVTGPLANKALYLDTDYEWSLVQDKGINCKILVPKKRP